LFLKLVKISALIISYRLRVVIYDDEWFVYVVSDRSEQIGLLPLVVQMEVDGPLHRHDGSDTINHVLTSKNGFADG
jgi:hypothetical protein